MNKYREWINKHYSSRDSARLQCKQATVKMKETFPELVRVRGHYYDLHGSKYPHWWLKTDKNIIIDPTSIQFLDVGLGEYEEWDESQPEPIGKCMNCGELTYDSPNFCNDECAKAVCDL